MTYYESNDMIDMDEPSYLSIESARSILKRIIKEIEIKGYCRLDRFYYICHGEKPKNGSYKYYGLFGLKNFRIVKRKDFKYYITLPYAVKVGKGKNNGNN